MIIRFSNHSSVYWAGKNFWSSHHAELQAAFVWALDTVHQGLIIKIIYSYLVTDFGQPQLLFHIDPCLWVRSRDLCLFQHWFANGFNTGHASSFRKSRILWSSRPADWDPFFTIGFCLLLCSVLPFTSVLDPYVPAAILLNLWLTCWSEQKECIRNRWSHDPCLWRVG